MNNSKGLNLIYSFLNIFLGLGIGDYLYLFNWGLGIGDWGLGIGDWAQSPLCKNNM